ncbi:hypothetical protein DVH24_020204 [Malus domestica]|uniref:NmrA-like domain-containing protein n=1 Tax=Malus domestica TaxID=3750 RepID=A0A498JCS7_MALDO|nr:hypothetical protein DVH24_020204 [Malus domestica]
MGSKSESVCVTGASGFIGSWLVMRLLERGYTFRATVRDPTNQKKVKHLLDLPKAETHLTLWKADLAGEGSFDEAIQGSTGVFHVATPMDFESKDPEMYFVSKTLAEQAAWKYAKEKIDFITIIPTLVIGPFLMFEGIDDNLDTIHFSSKKLRDIGFEFKYSLEDMFMAVDTCQAKGLIPIPAEKTEAADESKVVNVKISG